MAQGVDPLITNQKARAAAGAKAQEKKEARPQNLGSRASNDFVIRITAPRSEPLIAAG
jgi:hypothetical protein